MAFPRCIFLSHITAVDYHQDSLVLGIMFFQTTSENSCGSLVLHRGPQMCTGSVF
jgi:hypothetical protein